MNPDVSVTKTEQKPLDAKELALQIRMDFQRIMGELGQSEVDLNGPVNVALTEAIANAIARAVSFLSGRSI